MFQKFFTDTNISRFIKNLLRNSTIPLYTFVNSGDYIVKNIRYCYQGQIIVCTKSGYLEDSQNPANYIRVNLRTDTDLQANYQYHSKYMYYDTETHAMLGEYLRYIRNSTGLNLLPYYNCFNYKMLENVSLQKPDYSDEAADADKLHYKLFNNDAYKLVAIPVKFNQTYTIAIDCPVAYSYGLLIHGEVGMVLKSPESSSYYSDDLVSTYHIRNNSAFIKPYTIQIPSIESFYSSGTDSDNIDNARQSLIAQERNLCLAIQLPIDNESSVVVLEGDYSDSWNKLKSDYHQLSLLNFNSGTSFAFSDRLLEYLLGNVISAADTIDDNVKYVYDNLLNFEVNNNKFTILPQALHNLSKKTSAEWSNEYREALKALVIDLEQPAKIHVVKNNYLIDNTYSQQSTESIDLDLRLEKLVGQKNSFQDCDGFLNKDLEKVLRRNK